MNETQFELFTGCEMKIQGPKSEHLRDYTSTEDTLDQENNLPSDFFAEMMMGLMLQPAASIDSQQIQTTEEAETPELEGEGALAAPENKTQNYLKFVELAIRSTKQSTGMQASLDLPMPSQKIPESSQIDLTAMLTARMAPLLTDKANPTLMPDDQYQQIDTEIAHTDNQMIQQLSQLIEKPAKKVLPSELNSSFPQNVIENDDDHDELNVIQNVSVQKEESTLTNDHDITQIFAADKTAKTNQKDNNQYTQALGTLGYMIQDLTTPADKPLTQAKLTEPTFNDVKSAVMQGNQLAEAPVSIDIMSSLESVKKDVYTANIKIYPPELGSVIAKLKISKNTAELTLTTENDRVKQIVEANLPALRDHFIRSDLNLVSIDVHVHLANTDVGDQQPKQQADQQKPDGSMPRQEANQKTNNQTLVKKRLNSLVDTYV